MTPGPVPPPPPAGRTAAMLLAGAFAVLYAFGMPGYGVPGFPFVCLVPLIALSVASGTGRQAARRGFWAGTAANLLLYHWIAYTVAVPGKLGWIAGGAAALVVSLYLAVYVSAACWAAFRLHGAYGERGLWLFPAAWIALEFLRSVLMTGFPWLLLGYALSDDPWLRQAADLAGIPGLGFLLALAGVSAWRVLVLWARGSRTAAAVPAAVFAAVLAFLSSYGAWRHEGPAGEPARPAVTVGVAQGAIDQSVKWDPSYQAGSVALYGALTRAAAAGGARIVVWPETAAPFFFGWEKLLTLEVERTAAGSGVPVVFGAPWYEPEGGGKYYNSVFLVDGGGVPRGRYDKRRLVPFGEYVPWRPVLSFMDKLTAGEGDFSAGAGPALFPLLGENVGASVCYEAIFPGIIRESVLAGAAWLVNVTNDAWFGDTVAPKQHLAMARMRAVEFRRPLVRAANSGISALIDARGDTLAGMGVFRRGVVVARIVPGSGLSPYAKTGDLLSPFCTIMTFLIIFATLRRSDGHRTVGGKDRRA